MLRRFIRSSYWAVIGFLGVMLFSPAIVDSRVFAGGSVMVNTSSVLENPEKDRGAEPFAIELLTVNPVQKGGVCFTYGTGEKAYQEKRKGFVFDFNGPFAPLSDEVGEPKDHDSLMESKEPVEQSIDDIIRAALGSFTPFAISFVHSGPMRTSLLMDSTTDLGDDWTGNAEKWDNRITVQPQSEADPVKGPSESFERLSYDVQSGGENPGGVLGEALIGIFSRIRPAFFEVRGETQALAQSDGYSYGDRGGSFVRRGRGLIAPITDFLDIHLSFETEEILDQDPYRSICAGMTLNF